MSAGVKLKVLSALTVTVPRAGLTVALNTSSVPPSISRSLASTAMLLIATLIGVLAMSLTTTGASLTELTARLTVAGAEVPPLPSMTM